MERLYHQGVMRTRVDDCQFVCVTQADYCRIQLQGQENTRRHEEAGRLVLVTEQRSGPDGSRRGHIAIRVCWKLFSCVVSSYLSMVVDHI